MNREKVTKEILELSATYNNMLCELPTSFGKTRIAITVVSQHKNIKHILIVIPRNVLIQNWISEFRKWGMSSLLEKVTFTTYVSLPKHANKWDIVIFDEAHHISERCREALTSFNIKRSILLSATVKKEMKDELREVFDNLYTYKIKVKDAINNEILPDPKVFLLPLKLDNNFPTESIWKNPKGKTPVQEVSWANRWSFIKQKVFKVRIFCTEQQYYEDLSSQIDWFKTKYMKSRNEVFKSKWLRLAGERLKYLSDKKTVLLKQINDKYPNERILTFCNSINQTESIGNCINSKNKTSLITLEAFNNGEVNHISAVNMLNEGCNLTNCRIGVYGNLNSSEIIVMQRLGRLLRHNDPIIIIPFYKNTREEELVHKMLENYNPELITIINSINEIKL